MIMPPSKDNPSENRSHTDQAQGSTANLPALIGRYGAPGDEPMAVDVRLKLNQPFKIERSLVKRLKQREINVKEAFTLRDLSGAYFRASLKELHGGGGRAVAYERMD